MPKKIRGIIKRIYQHPGNIYSIVLKNEETIWCNDQVELYDYLRQIAANC